MQVRVANLIGVRKSDGPPRLVSAAGVAGLPAPAPTADQRKWVTFTVENQGQCECCVGESAEYAHWIAVGSKGSRISPTFVWKVALEREQSRTGQYVLNEGVQPSDGYDGQIAMGVLPRDNRDDDPVANLKVPTAEDIVAAYPYRRSPGDFVPISDGDITTAQQFWTLGAQTADHGVPIEFTMTVDDGYAALDAKNPVWNGPSGTVLGAHRQCTAGYTTVGGVPCAIIVSSWGSSHGDGGIVFIPLTKFQQVATEMVASLSGPVLP
jgi:hypothetical protein